MGHNQYFAECGRQQKQSVTDGQSDPYMALCFAGAGKKGKHVKVEHLLVIL